MNTQNEIERLEALLSFVCENKTNGFTGKRTFITELRMKILRLKSNRQIRDKNPVGWGRYNCLPEVSYEGE